MYQPLTFFSFALAPPFNFTFSLNPRVSDHGHRPSRLRRLLRGENFIEFWPLLSNALGGKRSAFSRFVRFFPTSTQNCSTFSVQVPNLSRKSPSALPGRQSTTELSREPSTFVLQSSPFFTIFSLNPVLPFLPLLLLPSSYVYS